MDVLSEANASIPLGEAGEGLARSIRLVRRLEAITRLSRWWRTHALAILCKEERLFVQVGKCSCGFGYTAILNVLNPGPDFGRESVMYCDRCYKEKGFVITILDVEIAYEQILVNILDSYEGP